MPKNYIVHILYRYQDGSEEHVYIHPSIPDALAFIETQMNAINGVGHTYTLFELGKQLPLEITHDSIQPPAPPPVKLYKANTKK